VPITSDWQGNLRSLTFGAGSDWQIDEPGITGLGIPSARTRDAERGDRAGDAGGDDVLPRRILTVPLVGTFDSAGEAWVSFEEELKVAWAEGIVDESLDLRLPGMPATGRRYFGRARGLDDDLSDLKSGVIRTLCTFEALDPFGYGDEVTTGPESGSFAIAYTGTAPSDRVVLTVVGNGGTPQIVNASDEGQGVIFAAPVTGTRIIDLRTKTVIDGTATNVFDELSPVNLWFELLPGLNDLTLTGAASVDVAYRPAFR
jgi:hypothetical protein